MDFAARLASMNTDLTTYKLPATSPNLLERCTIANNALMPYEQSSCDRSGGKISNLVVRSVCAKDLTNLAEILADSFHCRTGIKGWFYPLLRLGIYEDLRNRLRSPSNNHQCLVAIASMGDRAVAREYLAGTVEIALRRSISWGDSSYQYPYISNLAVQRSCRRQGVAQQLLLCCESTALQWGCKDLYLHVLESNQQARQLYLKAGYQVEQVDSAWNAWCLQPSPRLLLRKCL
jgi:ribosomal protein S18 acetylase RimI-like enzyme